MENKQVERKMCLHTQLKEKQKKTCRIIVLALSLARESSPKMWTIWAMPRTKHAGGAQKIMKNLSLYSILRYHQEICLTFGSTHLLLSLPASWTNHVFMSYFRDNKRGSRRNSSSSFLIPWVLFHGFRWLFFFTVSGTNFFFYYYYYYFTVSLLFFALSRTPCTIPLHSSSCILVIPVST